MKYYRLLNSDDGMIVDEVDGTTPDWCKTAFIYKDEYGYVLIDKDSGLSICRTFKRKNLETEYIEFKKEKYDEFRKTDTYKIKVERFEKLKVAYHMKRG